ncbi:MAG: PQQ-dependent sugar dehydrogenase [Steroidobacter sp.]
MQTSKRSLPPQIAWHGLAILILLCLPVLKHQALWWELRLRDLAPLVILLAAYGASALAVLIFVRVQGAAAAARALMITLAVSCLFLAMLLAARFDTPRYLLLSVLAAAVLLIPLSVASRGVRAAGLIALGVALLATAGFTVYTLGAVNQADAAVNETYLKTAFYNVHVVSHENLIPAPATRGGGVDHLGDEVLLGDGGGLLYALSFASDGRIQTRALPARVPLNREEFAAAYGGSARAPERGSGYSELGPPRVQTWRFRVADILTQSDGDALRIFASHHHWKPDEDCFAVRVSVIDASLGALEESLGAAEWRTLYESSPCIPLSGEQRKLGKNPFKGEEIGGRMALLDGDTLLLTLGDHGFSGVESLQAFSQDPEAAYGKTISIDLNTHANEIYTFGHRNPQGLYVAGDGRVWLAEHGSQGGDEVNLLVAEANYGWPLVTYGTEYGAFAWPLSERQGRHDGFVQPAYAWTPSIGVSGLTGFERDLFDIWRGDLIAGSLATRSLYRLVIEGDRIVLAEEMEVGRRVRDLLEMKDGRLLLWTDENVLITLAPARGMTGATSYGMLCTGCHGSVDGITHRIGPDLYRIVDRPIASAPEFDNYSAALKAMGGDWTKERLDAFLRDPQAAAPGTTMAFAGVKDDVERAALIEHLATFVQPARR